MLLRILSMIEDAKTKYKPLRRISVIDTRSGNKLGSQTSSTIHSCCSFKILSAFWAEF